MYNPGRRVASRHGPGPVSCPNPAGDCPVRLSLFLALAALPAPAVAAPFELKPTDRLVLIGSTLIEREQRYGYWETVLTARAPGLKVRNLGWSGDDVYGTARRAFDLDKPDIGRKRLVELTVAEKPTAILICYGGNEAFEGQAGLERFKKGLEKLLDELAPTKARIALMSPPPLEDKGRPLPDPGPQNKRLATYRDVIKQVADTRGLYFADLFQALGGPVGLWLILWVIHHAQTCRVLLRRHARNCLRPGRRQGPRPRPGTGAQELHPPRGLRGQPVCRRPAPGQADPDELRPPRPALGRV